MWIKAETVLSCAATLRPCQLRRKHTELHTLHAVLFTGDHAVWQRPGLALGNARWNDDRRCPQLAAFVKTLHAQKVMTDAQCSSDLFKSIAVMKERL